MSSDCEVAQSFSSTSEKCFREGGTQSRSATTATPATPTFESEYSESWRGSPDFLRRQDSPPITAWHGSPDLPPFGHGHRSTLRGEERRSATMKQIEKENVKGMLQRLDSIRQLAGHAQVLRRKESREKNTRRVNIEQMYSLLLEEAEFKTQAVRQRNVLAMLDGIQLQNSDIFFFSVDEANRGVQTPSVQLRDAIARPQRIAARLLVDSEMLGRMFSQLSTRQILDIVNKCSQYLEFMQTSYQVKCVQDAHDDHVRNVSGLACYGSYILATDSMNKVIWRCSVNRFTPQGNHQVELFAGGMREEGFKDGPGLSSRFSCPMGIAVSHESHEAFVADAGIGAIRRIDLKRNVVSTINLVMSPAHAELNCFEMLKGICTIHGHKTYFAEMDKIHAHSEGEYKAQLAEHGTPISSGVSSQASSEKSGDGDESGSSNSDSSSSNDDTSSSLSSHDSGDAQNEKSALTKEERLVKRKQKPSVEQGGQGLSLEQSLSYERMKKYTVLNNQHRVNQAQSQSQAATRMSSQPATIGSSSHRNSVNTIRQEQEELPPEVRLAVTTDLCVWYINPYTGRTDIIAGHPKLAGYYDAEGLSAHFSSPKGLTNIGSVLLVADYWNNAIRCINLCTAQVDTIVDFAPQGPTAICVSDSGTVYALDGDNIYHANILRIRSMPSGSSQENSYESFFATGSREISRQTSFSTAGTEVWDVYKLKAKDLDGRPAPSNAALDMWSEIKQASGDGKQVHGEGSDWRNAWLGGGTNDFTSKLQAHLDEMTSQSDSATLAKKKKTNKKRKKKKKRKAKKKEEKQAEPQTGDQDEKKSGLGDSDSGEEDEDGKGKKLKKHNQPGEFAGRAMSIFVTDAGTERRSLIALQPIADTEDTQDDATDQLHKQLQELLGNKQSEANEGEEVPPAAPIESETADETDATGANRSPLRRMDATESMVSVSTDKSNPTCAGKLGSKSSSRRGSTESSQKKKPSAQSLKVQKAPSVVKSPARRKSEVEEGDFVERMRQLSASRRASRCEDREDISFKDGLPLTLRDLGVFERGDHGRRSPRPGGKGPFQASAEALSKVLYHDNMMYRVMSVDGQEGSCVPGSSPDAGTVMVTGGKAYIRDTNTSLLQTGAGTQNSWSQAGSRRNSRQDDSFFTGQFSLMGEDEDGHVVNFVDLTQSHQSAQPLPERRDSADFDSAEFEDMFTEMNGGSSLGLQQTLYSAAQPRSGRRGSSTAESLNPSRRESISKGSRRASLFGANAPRQRGSISGLLGAHRASPSNTSPKDSLIPSRRNSFRGPASRRGSTLDILDATGSGSNSRRSSLVVVPMPPSVPGRTPAARRRPSLSVPVPGNADMTRRTSGEFSIDDVGGARSQRGSMLGVRRLSNVNIMPTLHDAAEEESEKDSSSGPTGMGKIDEIDTDKPGGTTEGSEAKDKTGQEETDDAESSPRDRPRGTTDDEAQATQHLCQEVASILQRTEQDGGATEKSGTQEESVDSTLPSRGATPSTPSALEFTSPSEFCVPSPSSTASEEKRIMNLADLSFTRDISLDNLMESGTSSKSIGTATNEPSQYWGSYHTTFHNATDMQLQSAFQPSRAASLAASSTMTSTFGTYKVAAAVTTSNTWRTLQLPELLSAKSASNQSPNKYPNTPLSMIWYENDGECYLFVGLLCRPTLLKIIPPKHHEPDKGGRFHVLPVDSQQVLLADETSHQIRLLNHQYFACKHLAGCGKRGYLDGPLETCRMHSPCSMTLDPKSHYIYVADRGNHAIRKIDLMSGLMSTVVGNGTRGNYDGNHPNRQALDSPFEVSFVEPHYLIISCSDNSIRSFNLKTKMLETILVGS